MINLNEQFYIQGDIKISIFRGAIIRSVKILFNEFWKETS